LTHMNFLWTCPTEREKQVRQDKLTLFTRRNYRCVVQAGLVKDTAFRIQRMFSNWDL